VSIETKTFDVDGVTYRVTQFGAKKGRDVLVSVVKVIGPAIGRATNPDAAATVDFGAALVEFCMALDATQLDKLCVDFAAQCEFSTDGERFIPLGKQGTFDDHFAGRYLQLTQWLKGCFEVNYAGFFSGLQATAGLQLGSLTAAPTKPVAK